MANDNVRALDPLLGFQFSVQVDQDVGNPLLNLALSAITGGGFILPIKGYFTEVSGLQVEYEIAEYKTVAIVGGIPQTRFMPGRPIYSPITLKRGVTDSEWFWFWHQILMLGAKPLFTASVTVTLYDRNYSRAAEWVVQRAWPSKVSGIEVRSDSNDYVIEELTLHHSGIERKFASLDNAALEFLITAVLPS